MGPYRPESPNRLLAIKEVLEDVKVAAYLTKIYPRAATKEEIALVHDAEYISRIESTKGKAVFLDPDTSTSPDTYDAALLAAGGVIACVDYLFDKGSSKRAFAFVRPPGHHAEEDRAMGFCIFNNIAIAAEYAIKKYSLKKVAILDFDVHHGNGTQNHFYGRDDVFFTSTHAFPFYPGTGRNQETGSGKGKGFTLNIPIPVGSGEMEFKNAWTEIIKAVRKYGPELLLISAGFDAHEDDPIGGLSVTTGGFRWLVAELVKLAKETSEGRIVFVLEGGYSLTALKSCVRATLEEMF